MSYWQEVEINVNYEAQEAVSEILMNLGAKGVAIEGDIIMRQALVDRLGDYYPHFTGSEQVAIKAYFSQHKTEKELQQLLNTVQDLVKFGLNVGKVKLDWKIVCDAEWADAWKDHYHPIIVGDVVIQPSWEMLSPQDNKVYVTLDPGMAFGTGTHPSTYMCIEALQQVDLIDKIVWDIGTGSGILAITAAKLGAKQVKAVDIDPVAVKVCSQNAQLNQVDFQLEQGSIEQISGTADIIVANIIADVIIELLPQICSKLQPKGLFFASGIINQRAAEVRQEAYKQGLRQKWKNRQDEWVFYCFSQGEPNDD